MTDVLHLFPVLNSSLIELLSGLNQRQWNTNTLCSQWKVRDIAAHLLDGALRRISAGRDGNLMDGPEIHSYSQLVSYLNELNADWVKAYRRVSPQLIISQLSSVYEELYTYLKTLDPEAPAIFPVSWAGEGSSTNRFDIEREYTEQWHHQQQIRMAVGAASILNREFYNPFLRICMKALPYHYRSLNAEEGSTVRVEVVGDTGGVWCIQYLSGSWHFSDKFEQADSMVFIDENIAWMLFSNAVKVSEAAQFWQVLGDRQLGAHVLSMRTFMVY